MQMFLQLAGYLGIPVIGWNADNSGLERRVGFSSPSRKLIRLFVCFGEAIREDRYTIKIIELPQIKKIYIFQSHGSSLRVQLAPSLEHQVAAMIAIMFRFSY